MRRITHPGPPAPVRVDALPCQAVPLALTLRAGLTLTEAVAAALAEAGFDFGYLRLDGLALAPLVYVMPAPASPEGHAAWYSATHRLTEGRITHGGGHFGRREGRGFIHSHSRWEARELAGPGMGHLLCDDCIIAHDATVQGWGLRGAGLVAEPDAETRFTLFRPQPTGPCTPNALLVTLRPNQEIGAALQALCAGTGIGAGIGAGIDTGVAWGIASGIGMGALRIEGIGSLVGTSFETAPAIESYGTEILIVEGRVTVSDAALRVASVGFDGRSELDDLAPGRNAVCVTAELLALPAARG